jgi:hypothetical protein
MRTKAREMTEAEVVARVLDDMEFLGLIKLSRMQIKKPTVAENLHVQHFISRQAVA